MSTRGILPVGVGRGTFDLREHEQDRASVPDGYRGIVTDDKSVPRVLRFKRSPGHGGAGVIAPRETSRI